MVETKVKNSANGTVSHTPLSPKITGYIMIPSTTNNSPLCKDTSTEVRASPSEVKKLDDRMFEPFSRKAKAQTAAPMEVIFSTWLPPSAKNWETMNSLPKNMMQNRMMPMVAFVLKPRNKVSFTRFR